MFHDLLTNAAGFAGDVCAIGACLTLICRPIRDKVLGLSKVQEGAKCILRSEIVHIYYHNLSDKKLREYEYQSLVKCFEAYDALGGNSFVKKIMQEMQEWEIVP